MAGDEFHADHQPLTAHFADHRATRLPLAQPIQKIRADARRICRVLALDQVDRRQRRRATQRIAAVRVPVRAALPLLHPLLLRHHQSNRHTAAKALGERHDIRGDADMMRRKHSARATNARLHFVEDQHDAMPIAQLAQPAQKSLRRHEIATFALHRLDQYACHFLRRHIARKQHMFDVVQHRFALVIAGEDWPVVVRIRHMRHTGHRREKPLLLRVLARREGK